VSESAVTRKKCRLVCLLAVLNSLAAAESLAEEPRLRLWGEASAGFAFLSPEGAVAAEVGVHAQLGRFVYSARFLNLQQCYLESCSRPDIQDYSALIGVTRSGGDTFSAVSVGAGVLVARGGFFEEDNFVTPGLQIEVQHTWTWRYVGLGLRAPISINVEKPYGALMLTLQLGSVRPEAVP